MKKNRSLKYIIIILIIFLISSTYIGFANADSGIDAAGLTRSGSVFDDGAKETNVTKLANNSANLAISIMRIVGITIAVLMLLVLSIKYMTSAAGERADIKKHAIVYVVGAVLLFGAVGILGMINELTTNALKEEE